jgi:DNA-directed RNA polymerase subunit RPC12/RpoP
MAHWIIEDYGFGGTSYRCSHCGNSWNNIYSDVSRLSTCPSCREPINRDENEYADEHVDDRKKIPHHSGRYPWGFPKPIQITAVTKIHVGPDNIDFGDTIMMDREAARRLASLIVEEIYKRDGELMDLYKQYDPINCEMCYKVIMNVMPVEKGE